MTRVETEDERGGTVEGQAMQARTGTDVGLAQMLALRLANRFWRAAAALAQGWRRLVGGTAYRPEKHYMRGPGPKWRAKHAGAEPLRSGGHAPQDAARSG
jgi:hypothetical protein